MPVFLYKYFFYAELSRLERKSRKSSTNKKDILNILYPEIEEADEGFMFSKTMSSARYAVKMNLITAERPRSPKATEGK